MVLAGCVLFFSAYQLWFSFYVLMAALLLPVLSLLLSLPAMITARLNLRMPGSVTLGEPLELTVFYGSFLPTPPWKCTIRVESSLTGQRQKWKEADNLPTDHCDGFHCRIVKAKVFDYLGLFSLPMKRCPTQTVTVRPKAAPMDLTSLDQPIPKAWRPKPGGGYAENHELRLYRPGDNIQQIHWKLSSKTGKLILREPMEPIQGLFLLRLDLNGSPEVLDRKLGRLLWLGNQLLERELPFRIQALTGKGILNLPVSREAQLLRALDRLLLSCPAVEGSLLDRPELADWQYFIGGDANEI